jgi:Fe-S-cluster-containing dehydrogenase component
LSRITIDLNQFDAEVSASFCMQCLMPQCLASCPVEGAMVINEAGSITIDGDACTGCGECAKACQFNEEGKVLKQHRSKNVYFKCDLCSGDPACIWICPTGALKIVEIQR